MAARTYEICMTSLSSACQPAVPSHISCTMEKACFMRSVLGCRAEGVASSTQDWQRHLLWERDQPWNLPCAAASTIDIPKASYRHGWMFSFVWLKICRKAQEPHHDMLMQEPEPWHLLAASQTSPMPMQAEWHELQRACEIL